MSTNIIGKTQFNDSNLDAFGKLRISNAITQFECKFTYGTEEKLYNTTTATGGTATFLTNEAAYQLSTTTSSGSRVLRESYRYMQYHPGKSQLVMMTGVFGSPMANCVKRMGYYDDNDGLFFIQNGTTGFGIAERTSTSGSPVDSVIYQSSWNVDKMDGTGPSGLTFDPTKTNIFMIDFQWLGVGTVRYSVVINGAIIKVHETHHANILTQVYMKSAWLPLRYEIVNISSIASPASLKQICSTVMSEGGMDEVGTLYSAATLTTTSAAAGAWIPVVSIRVNPTLNGVPFRGKINITSFETLVTSNTACVVTILEGATLTTPSWVSAGTASGVSYDISSTSLSGGISRYTGYNGKTSNSSAVPSDQMSGYANTIYTLAIRGVGGTATATGSINWCEII